MRYRTFSGKTKQEALEQFNIEKKIDPSLREARWIKHSEEEKTSLMGLKKEKIHTIIMGIPDFVIPDVKETSFLTGIEQSVINTGMNKKKKSVKQEKEENNDSLFILEGVNRIAEKISREQENPVVAGMERGMKKAQELDTLKSELGNVRQEMKHLQNLLSTHMKNAQNVLFQNKLEEERSLPNELDIYKQHLRWIERYLMEREFSLHFIDSFISHIEKTPELLNEKKTILEQVKLFLQENIPNQEITTDHYPNGNCIIFVGTTGVGKTASLIKCAAHLALMQKKTFRFLLLDKYKMNNNKQLEQLSGYMNSPFHSISNQEELSAHNHTNMDFTFIDTVGLSPNNTVEIKELTHWINSIPQKTDIHLVLSCNTKCSDHIRAYESFKGFGINHLLVTKIDESKTYGSVLSTAFQFKKPISFLTDGQEVPGDFKIANISKIINDSLR